MKIKNSLRLLICVKMLPTKQQSKTIDKSVEIAVCYKSIRTQYKSEHFMDTMTDHHFHSDQTGHSLKIKI